MRHEVYPLISIFLKNFDEFSFARFQIPHRIMYILSQSNGVGILCAGHYPSVTQVPIPMQSKKILAVNRKQNPLLLRCKFQHLGIADFLFARPAS